MHGDRKYDDRLDGRRAKRTSSRADRRPGSRWLIGIDIDRSSRFTPHFLELYQSSRARPPRDDSSTGSARKLREGVILEPNEALCETLIIAGRHSREETLRANSLTSLTVRLICVFI